MRYYITIASFILLSFNTMAQEEFILGKSANTLRAGGAAISGEYSSSAFGNRFIRRYGFDLAYGLSPRLTLSARGSFSEEVFDRTGFENGSLTAIYQLTKLGDLPKKWVFAPFLQATVVGRNAVLPSDINLDTQSSGFSGGMIATGNLESMTLSGSLAYAKVNYPQFISGLMEGGAVLLQLSAIKTIGLSADKESLKMGFMGEAMGQYNSDIQKDDIFFFTSGAYLDLLLGLQFTANDKYRLEVAIQDELFGDIPRFGDGLFHLRLKYLML